MEELRDKVHDWTLELIREGKTLQGLILMLSTWNFAYFKNVLTKFKLKQFENLLKNSDFAYFKNKKFEDINLSNVDNKKKIIKIYKDLSEFEGVKYVGATKIMYFLCPDVFVMWDTKIREYYEFEVSPEDYFNFMKKMQEMYKNGEFKDLEQDVTIARAIDLYNINNFSIFKE